MITTLMSKLMMFSILGLPILLSTFIMGNEQIQIFAVSEAGNTTGIAGKPEIIVSDINGTKLIASEIESEPCLIIGEDPITGELIYDCEWGPGPSILDTTLDLDMTMVVPNGQEIIFENITIKCMPSAETTEFAIHCSQS